MHDASKVEWQPTFPRRLHAQDLRGISRCVLRRLGCAPLIAQGAPAQGTADQPYTIEYYYKVQWGHQQEFHDLFLKNHYPLLLKIASTGRILSVKIETPAYHTTEDGRWDYRVTIRYKNSTVATTTNPDEEALVKQLWPDQETYKREDSADLKSSRRTGIYLSPTSLQPKNRDRSIVSVAPLFNQIFRQRGASSEIRI